MRPLIDHLVGARTKSWMLMLLGAVGLVLTIACANVANLLLSRATARERELGIRAALGAGRWRLVRQLMVESVVLSMVGTVLAIVLAWWGVQILRSSMPEGVPRVANIAVDLRVLGATAMLSVLTGLLFGVFPALQLSRPDLTSALKEGARTSTGGASHWMRSALVVAEVALAVILLVGAALFIGSFVALMRIDPGFDPHNVLTARVQPRLPPIALNTPRPDLSPQMMEIVDRVSRVPGVIHASVISGGMPLGGSMRITSMTVPGKEIPKGQDDGISIRTVTPDYHRALRIRLIAGRFFESMDHKTATPVLIINESAARKYFEEEDPIGRAAKLDDVERTIVGVVGDVHQSSLETAPRIEAYIPVAQDRVQWTELVVRTSGAPYDVLPQVKAAVLAVLPDVPLRSVGTMEEVMARRIAQRKLNMLLLGLFGLLGLVISAVGIYGVMAYAVAQRTREIGVRMALEATRRTVVAMVLQNATMLVASGLMIGGVGAWYLSAAAKAFLFRLEATDPRAFVAALASVSLAALIASAIPARRAASVDPMVALRAE